jgi:hypothetical protein
VLLGATVDLGRAARPSKGTSRLVAHLSSSPGQRASLPSVTDARERFERDAGGRPYRSGALVPGDTL